MTSSVRFFGIKAMTIGAALSMTAGLAFAGDTVSKNAIIDSLKAPPATRGLSAADPNKASETSFINSVRNRATRSLSMDERNQLDTIAPHKPKIHLESNF